MRRPRHVVAAAMVVLATIAAGPPAAAQDRGADATVDESRRAQLDRLRAEMSNQIHLQANDLVDELVFSWLSAPPFPDPTPVVLADVVAPLSYGSGFEALIENHLAQVILKNPGTNVALAHCPACNALVVHSDATGTVLGRGVDQPNALAKLRGTSGAEHALFLDFEAEGTALVLRARVTKLVEPLPIVYARTLSTRTSSAALLRNPNRLVSSEEARAEYLAVLEERGPFSVPVRFAITTFAPAPDAALQAPIPLPWMQVGVEYAITSARAWMGSITIGATFVPTLHAGGMVQVRASRLLSGTEASLTHPNVYGFVGAGLAVLQGQTATLLGAEPPTLPNQFGPVTSYLSLQTGIELRVSRRIGATVFAESLPTLYGTDIVGNYLADGPLAFLPLHSIGVEASFAF